MKKFKPFMFEIKTEEEAKVLWHILNCPLSGVCKYDWLMEEGIQGQVQENDVLWERFNEIYAPPKEKIK